MTIVQKMRDRLKESMKARDAVRTNMLRYWIAQLTLGTGEATATVWGCDLTAGYVRINADYTT